MGEDVDADGGVFKTNIGLPDKFPGRVIATPICENGFMGVALGMSITGMRPVVEIMFADFLPTAGDAIVNQLPKYRFMSGGQFTVPVTVRVVVRWRRPASAPSTAPPAESWFMAQPGLRVVTASSPGRRVRAAAGRDPEQRPGPVLRAQGAVRPQGARAAGAPSRRWAPRACSARAPT